MHPTVRGEPVRRLRQTVSNHTPSTQPAQAIPIPSSRHLQPGPSGSWPRLHAAWATRQPPDLFTLCVERLSALVAEDAEILASNQVIGEAYVALQHHYGVSKEDARTGLHTTLTSGLVAPLNGRAVLDALAASSGPGLYDRLIANDYARAGMDTLTLDRSMDSLPQAHLVSQ